MLKSGYGTFRPRDPYIEGQDGLSSQEQGHIMHSRRRLRVSWNFPTRIPFITTGSCAQLPLIGGDLGSTSSMEGQRTKPANLHLSTFGLFC